jgi:hypothetical protein
VGCSGAEASRKAVSPRALANAHHFFTHHLAREMQNSKPENGLPTCKQAAGDCLSLGRIREPLYVFEKSSPAVPVRSPDQGLLLCFTSYTQILLLHPIILCPSLSVFTHNSPHQVISTPPPPNFLEPLNIIPDAIDTFDWAQALTLSVIGRAAGERTIEKSNKLGPRYLINPLQ